MDKILHHLTSTSLVYSISIKLLILEKDILAFHGSSYAVNTHQRHVHHKTVRGAAGPSSHNDALCAAHFGRHRGKKPRLQFHEFPIVPPSVNLSRTRDCWIGCPPRELDDASCFWYVAATARGPAALPARRFLRRMTMHLG